MDQTNTRLSSGNTVQISLLSTTGVEHLAATMLADHLMISHTAACGKLAQAPSVLIDGIDAAAGARLHRILLALGLKVAIGDGATKKDRLDLSVQLAYRYFASSVMAEVSQILGETTESLSRAFAQPGGFILAGLARETAMRMRDALCRVKGVIVSVSDPDTAVYDLYTRDGITREATQPLLTHLQRIGLWADPVTGALATGLTAFTRNHILARFADRQILVLDRAFQRFDVVLTGMTGWLTADLADFLVSRTALPRARFEALSPARPLCIERGLTYAGARQFHADYESIGVHTRLRLSGGAIGATA
jgi:peptidoglycan hydrolase-like protein with peptidoglycan-binding domain